MTVAAAVIAGGMLVLNTCCAVLLTRAGRDRSLVPDEDRIPYDDLRFVVKLAQHQGYRDS